MIFPGYMVSCIHRLAYCGPEKPCGCAVCPFVLIIDCCSSGCSSSSWPACHRRGCGLCFVWKSEQLLVRLQIQIGMTECAVVFSVYFVWMEQSNDTVSLLRRNSEKFLSDIRFVWRERIVNNHIYSSSMCCVKKDFPWSFPMYIHLSSSLLLT